MKYVVSARWWTPELTVKFGKDGDVHEIWDKEFPDLIRKFGRLELNEGRGGAPRVGLKDREPEPLEFQNEYD